MSPADSSPGVNDNDEMIAAIIKQSGGGLTRGGDLRNATYEC